MILATQGTWDTTPLACHAFWGLHHGCKRAMPAFRLELDGPAATDVGRGDLTLPVLEPFRHHDLNAVRSPCHRVLDRFDLGFQHTGDNEARGPADLIKLERHGREDRIMHLAHDQTEDLEKRTFRRVLPRH